MISQDKGKYFKEEVRDIHPDDYKNISEIDDDVDFVDDCEIEDEISD